MLSAILFIFYFILLLFALIALMKAKKIDISPTTTAFIYVYKVLFGCIYGYIFLKFYRGDDTWMYHRESLLQYQKLIHHPIDYLKDFLPYSQSQTFNYYIQDLEYWSITKLLAVFNIFSRGNYYINVLFFDFLAIIGLLLIYKLLYVFYLNKKKLLILVLFFLPVTTFWLSGIRTEALLLLSMSVILYYTYKWFTQRRKTVYFIYIIIGLIGCFILRAQSLLIFIPAFFCLILCWKTANKAIVYFSSVYIICVVLFFASMLISSENNLSIPIIKRQQEFFKLHGNTSFKLDSLQPSINSFIKILPQAFSNTFLRPFVWEAKGALQIVSALNIIFFWVLLLMILFFHEKKWKQILNNPLLLLLIFYGISQVILIGYVVPFPGAIVRYKAIPELFLFLIITIIFDFEHFRFSIMKSFGR